MQHIYFICNETNIIKNNLSNNFLKTFFVYFPSRIDPYVGLEFRCYRRKIEKNTPLRLRFSMTYQSRTLVKRFVKMKMSFQQIQLMKCINSHRKVLWTSASEFRGIPKTTLLLTLHFVSFYVEYVLMTYYSISFRSSYSTSN